MSLGHGAAASDFLGRWTPWPGFPQSPPRSFLPAHKHEQGSVLFLGKPSPTTPGSSKPTPDIGGLASLERSPHPLHGHSVGVPEALGTCPAARRHDHLCVAWLGKLWGCSSLAASLAKPTAGPYPEGPPPTARLPSEASGPSEPSPPCLPLLATKQPAASGSSWVFSIKTPRRKLREPHCFRSKPHESLPDTPQPCTKWKINLKQLAKGRERISSEISV